MFELICNLQMSYIFCIIIGDVYQFMSHCLIPLDPCIQIPSYLFFPNRKTRKELEQDDARSETVQLSRAWQD